VVTRGQQCGSIGGTKSITIVHHSKVSWRTDCSYKFCTSLLINLLLIKKKKLLITHLTLNDGDIIWQHNMKKVIELVNMRFEKQYKYCFEHGRRGGSGVGTMIAYKIDN
jgi:hypothetical protein